MAIRIRKHGEGYIALCAAKSKEQEGDIYLDDGMHHALTEKFEIDFFKMGFIDTQPTEAKEIYTPPPDTSIFSKIELSVSEMCGISIQELKSGRKYGQIPTAKQLIVRILTELEYKPGTILENMPYMSNTQSIRSRYYASRTFEKYDKRFRIVLEQLKDIYLK